MRDSRFGATPQPSHKKILKSGRGKLGQAVDSVSNPLETAIFRIVGQALTGKTCSGRLTSGKISCLLLRKVIESVVIGSCLGHGLYCVQILWEYLIFCTHYA